VPVESARLRTVPLLANLNDSDLEQLARSTELKPASPGDVLTREGASGYTFFVILEGTVDVDRGGEFVETLGQGDFFGEMAILGEGRRNATVTAASPVQLAVLFGTEFRTLESRHPEVGERIKQKVIERVERSRR
jgi:voltage-gated potassium channel